MEINVDVTTCICEMHLLRHRSWRKWFGHHLLPRVSLLPFGRRRREGREMLGTRLIMSDIRQTRACAIFCVHYFILSRQARAQVFRERKKKCAWPSACFYAFDGSFSRHPLFIFTYTYAYVRGCATSENKAFMLEPMPACAFKGYSFVLHLRLCLRG